VGQAHTHDFLAFTYFETGGGSLRLGKRERSVEAGDAYVAAPGEVIGGGEGASGFREAEGWGIFFPPEALGLQAPGVFLSWADVYCARRRPASRSGGPLRRIL